MNEVEELYTKKAKLYQRFFIDLMGYGPGMRNTLSKSDYLKPNSKILDAGCGTGLISRNIIGVAKKKNITGLTLSGFDLTQAMLDVFIEWILETKTKNITLKKANVLNLDQELAKDWKGYDLIATSAMLEYIPKDQIRQAIGNLCSRMKQDGATIIFITRQNLLMKFLIKMWWKANMYKKDEIRQVLLDSGYKTVTFKRFGFPYWYLNIWGLVIEART